MSDITISYKGSSIATMDESGTKTLLTEGKYCEDDISVAYVKPASPSGTKQISITQNGTITEDVTNYANAQITANVPNSYSAGDEGKVVSSGALVSQTSKNISSNGTVDTTANNQVVVNVPNSYSAGDEGKVVSNGSLVSQTSDTVTANDTYDTTLINSLTVNVSGGGSSGTMDSDYITLEYAIVTVGANSVTNASQVIPYLLGLANFATSGYIDAWCSVVDHTTWHNNMYVCTEVTNRLDSGRKFYRYRNGAISSTGEGSSYDATVTSGDKYLVACLRWKGVPTV